MDKLLKKLNKMYFNLVVSKYTLPEEIKINKIKVTTQSLSNIYIKDFLSL